MSPRLSARLAAPLLLAACARGPRPAAPAAPAAGGALVFADEFSGAAIDRTKWEVYTGPVYNDELQAYVDDSTTMRIVHGAAAEGAADGALLIHAHAREATRRDGTRAAYVSGRLHGRQLVRYGTVTARMKLPAGAGLWPAFWLLGRGDWPGSGEIDVMENVGDPSWVSAALHGQGFSGDRAPVRRDTLPAARDVTAWHEYAARWTADAIEFRVDGAPYFRMTRDEMARLGPPSPVDSPKYPILNLAIGGGYPAGVNGVKGPQLGLPPSSAQIIRDGGARVLVDWVRVTRE